MRPSRDFATLHRAAAARLKRIRKDAVVACAGSDSTSRIAIAHLTTELLNVWANFCRSYFLSCTISARLESGGRVVATTYTGNTFADAINVAVRANRIVRTNQTIWKRREEPAWHSTPTFIKACTSIGCSHLAQIAAALSMGTRTFEDLPVFRNFFAHRNESTVRNARVAGSLNSIATYKRHPTQIAATPPVGRPFPLLVEWVDDVAVTVEMLCE